MVHTELAFRKRVSRLGHKHAAMAKGYELRMRGDGLVVVHPRRQAPRRLPLIKALVFLTVGFCVVKALMLSVVGADTYEARVTKLGQGTVIEQSGAWLMQIDPLTGLVSGVLRQIVH